MERTNYAESEADEDDGLIISDEEQENPQEDQENAPAAQNDDENADENKENDEEEGEKKVVKAKRVVRNPQPKLNAETLRGPRGIPVLEACFKDVKYKGKGHEMEDLQVIMKTYEHWCHRLFPKLPFDDCIKKIETLGNKKPVITYVKKIRLGMEDFANNEFVRNEDDDAPVPENATDAPLNDDEDIENVFRRLAEEGRERVIEPAVTQRAEEEEEPELTEEQMERIRKNRELALERRRLRMLKEAEKETETDVNVEEANESQQLESSGRLEEMNSTQESNSNEETVGKEASGSQRLESSLHLEETDSNSNEETNAEEANKSQQLESSSHLEGMDTTQEPNSNEERSKVTQKENSGLSAGNDESLEELHDFSLQVSDEESEVDSSFAAPSEVSRDDVGFKEVSQERADAVLLKVSENNDDLSVSNYTSLSGNCNDGTEMEVD